jgi:hypothetical protein
MDASIQARMQDTRRQLIENFDTEVHDRLRVQLQNTTASLDRFSRRFWNLSQYVLSGMAWFDAQRLSFDLKQAPAADIPAGRYHLISRNQPHNQAHDPHSLAVNESSFDSYTYRLSHPLGEWVIHTAQAAETPMQRIVFDTQQNETRIAMVEALRGKSGVLTLQKLSVDSFEKQEYLLFSAMTDQGDSLDQETCEKLMACQAMLADEAVQLGDAMQTRLQAEGQRHAQATVAQSLEANNKHFTEARDKLDRWADDMVQGAEQALKNTKEQIKVAQREARQAPTLDEQQTIQERIAKLERQQRKQRQEIFQIEDDIHDKRDQLIEQLTQRMAQRVSAEPLFTIAWQVR